MTVELARRLIESGLPLPDIEAALLLVVEQGVSLPEALARRDPSLLVKVEQELARCDLPAVLTVRLLPDLFARLPVGLCRRLLAVPVHVDPKSGRVDLAAVEPLDPHVAQEFAFHLDQPIRVLQASFEAVTAALERLQPRQKLSSLVPEGAFSGGSDAPIPLIKMDKAVGSDAPIPLVRRSLPPRQSAQPKGRLPISPSPLGKSDAASSFRSRPLPADLIQAAELERASAAALEERSEVHLPSARERLDAATSPEAVLEVMRDALHPAVSIVFAVRASSFEGRTASSSIEQRTLAKNLLVLGQQPSVLESALKSGFYLGPIPNTPNHRELRDALPADAVSEVYVTVVTVSDRPSLIWLIAGFEQSLDLTRRADEIALIAGRALERIVRQRKKG